MKFKLIASLIVLSLSGCGSDHKAPSEPEVVIPELTKISGKLHEAIENAKVCVDMNKSASCDQDEPQSMTNAQGEFGIEIPVNLKDKHGLVAEVTKKSINGVTKKAISGNVNMTAFPTYKNISPMSTIAYYVASKGISQTVAEEHVKNTFGTSLAIDTNTNVVMQSDHSADQIHLLNELRVLNRVLFKSMIASTDNGVLNKITKKQQYALIQCAHLLNSDTITRNSAILERVLLNQNPVEINIEQIDLVPLFLIEEGLKSGHIRIDYSQPNYSSNDDPEMILKACEAKYAPLKGLAASPQPEIKEVDALISLLNDNLSSIGVMHNRPESHLTPAIYNMRLDDGLRITNQVFDNGVFEPKVPEAEARENFMVYSKSSEQWVQPKRDYKVEKVKSNGATAQNDDTRQSVMMINKDVSELKMEMRLTSENVGGAQMQAFYAHSASEKLIKDPLDRSASFTSGTQVHSVTTQAVDDIRTINCLDPAFSPDDTPSSLCFTELAHLDNSGIKLSPLDYSYLTSTVPSNGAFGKLKGPIIASNNNKLPYIVAEILRKDDDVLAGKVNYYQVQKTGEDQKMSAKFITFGTWQIETDPTFGFRALDLVTPDYVVNFDTSGMTSKNMSLITQDGSVKMGKVIKKGETVHTFSNMMSQSATNQLVGAFDVSKLMAVKKRNFLEAVIPPCGYKNTESVPISIFKIKFNIQELKDEAVNKKTYDTYLSNCQQEVFTTNATVEPLDLSGKQLTSYNGDGFISEVYRFKTDNTGEYLIAAGSKEIPQLLNRSNFRWEVIDGKQIVIKASFGKQVDGNTPDYTKFGERTTLDVLEQKGNIISTKIYYELNLLYPNLPISKVTGDYGVVSSKNYQISDLPVN
ncbi:MAG: hypothetical protein ACPGUD_07745 [Parashewanella sp.]